MSTFPPTLFEGQKFAILGLGRNGLPAVTALAAMGAEIHAWDDNEESRAGLAALTLPHTIIAPILSLKGYSGLVLSPGIAHHLPTPHEVARFALKENIPILSDAELLYIAVKKAGSKARFASITGTNGKSTTTTLLAHILSQNAIPIAAGGNLGPAALALPLLPDEGVYVLEMSSYMLERLPSFHSDAACLLNITPDHLDRHGTMEGYQQAKENVFAHQNIHDLSLVSIDDVYVKTIYTHLKHNGLAPLSMSCFAGNEADIYTDGQIIYQKGKPVFSIAGHAALPGLHNAQNAMAAGIMAHHLGLSFLQIEHAIRSFAGLAHRQQRIATYQNISFINDSKATNADATSRALECYDPLIWIAGGTSKAGGIDSLTEYFPRITKAFLIGRDAELLAHTLQKNNVPFEIVANLEQAVPQAYAYAQAHHIDTVLFSPACASFDQFKNFEHRGQRFVEIVTALGDKALTPDV